MSRRVQLIILVFVALAGIRIFLIYRERHAPAPAPKVVANPNFSADDYVVPTQVHAYDLKSAKQLSKQPVWVKVGYAYSCYPYDPATHHSNLAHETGKLLPLQKLEIKDIVTGISPKAPGERQVLAVFEDGGKFYAVPIGTEKSGDYRFYSDDMLFIQDPRQLYKHWPTDVWQAIDQHQVKPGMSELQADFAIGIGLLEQGGDSTDKTLDYPNGGKPLSVSYHDGKAVEIRPGPTS